MIFIIIVTISRLTPKVFDEQLTEGKSGHALGLN